MIVAPHKGSSHIPEMTYIEAVYHIDADGSEPLVS